MTLARFHLSLRHAWALGQRCGTCGYDRPEALERASQGILCRACRLRHQGYAPLERHHALGRNAPITAPLHANAHARLTALEASYGGRWWAMLVLAWTRLVQGLLDALRRRWRWATQWGRLFYRQFKAFYRQFKAFYRRSHAFYRLWPGLKRCLKAVLAHTLPFYCQRVWI